MGAGGEKKPMPEIAETKAAAKEEAFNEIIEKIGMHTGKKISPQYVKKELSYVENLQADTQLMKSVLNINPISIDSGITKFAKYLKII